jgi:5-methylcytosine-specific restriction endonuclease McrA
MLKGSPDAGSYHVLAGRPGRDRKAHYRKPSEKGKPLRQSAPNAHITFPLPASPIGETSRLSSWSPIRPSEPREASRIALPSNERIHFSIWTREPSRPWTSRYSLCICLTTLVRNRFGSCVSKAVRAVKSRPSGRDGYCSNHDSVRIWTWAVCHGLRRNVQPVARYPLIGSPILIPAICALEPISAEFQVPH